MKYQVTKTFGHDLGLSVAFRQHRADSHCHFVHGYALSICLTFEADDLDARGWVIDFGGFGVLKEWIRHTFDHTMLVAADDPLMDDLQVLANKGGIRMCVVPATGCEAFAGLVANYVGDWLHANQHRPRVRLVKVTVAEHGANSASVVLDPQPAQ